MKKLFVLPLVILLAASCGNSNNNNQRATNADAERNANVTANTPNTRYTVDYEGTYKGTLPCADCRGIETELEIKGNGEFVLKTKYLSNRSDQKDLEYNVQGNYSWNREGKILTLNGVTDQPNKYMLSENMLVQLDMEGKRVEGALADKYILRK